jgi:hypothetical protein
MYELILEIQYMKFHDYGAFFCKMHDNTIWVAIYIKTNYILKHAPHHKIHYLDGRNIKEKNHVKNKIWGAHYDRKWFAYEMEKDLSYKEMEQRLTSYSLQNYEYDPTDEHLYEKIKVPGYGKTMFDKQCKFIEQQLALLR